MIRLEQALHNRWAADATLSELVPPSRVWSEWRNLAELPSAQIACTGEEHVWLTPKKEWAERVRIVVMVWSESFDHVRRTSDQVKRVFHRATFDLGDGARVVRCTYRRSTVDRDRHDVWQAKIVFEALAMRPFEGA